ncbi:MAG: DUF2064 domain-containing protein [Promethearchaeota archaeon]
MKDNVVIIYTRWPRTFYSKKRIAKDTSPDFARRLATACLDDLVENIKSDFYDIIPVVDSNWEKTKFKLNYELDATICEGETQSEKFFNIFTYFFNKEEYKKAVLIPSDVPFLREADMISYFARLNKNSFVHGPETNGGIYAIGIKGPLNENIFEDVEWSTTKTFSQIKKASVNAVASNENISLRKASKKVYSLSESSDLNTFQDILNLRSEIRSNCRNLYSLLNEAGYYTPDVKYINYDDLSINIPVVMGIVERDKSEKPDILIQTRYKPAFDGRYSNKIEIPTGLVERFERPQMAAVREIEEETGIIVDILEQDRKLKIYKTISEYVEEFNPFCSVQQIVGERAYQGSAFICRKIGGKLKENPLENRNPRWISFEELNDLLTSSPDKIFPINIPPLMKYIDLKR